MPRAASLGFDRVADVYDATRGGEERGARMAADLEPWFSAAGRTLEVGVGTGVVALALQRGGRDVVGVDLSAPMARHAVGRLGRRVAVGDAERMPVASASVDDAYSVWLLQLVRDISLVLREVARVVRPGGRYLVVPTDATPVVDEPIGRAQRALNRVAYGGPRQDHADAVVAAARDCDLRVVEVADGAVHEFDERPSQMLEAIEKRQFSMMWEIPDETWAEIVPPIVEELSALPDRPIRRRARSQVVVLERDRGGAG